MGILGHLGNNLEQRLRDTVYNLEEELVYRTKHLGKKIERQIMARISGIIFVTIGTVFLLLAAVYFMIEYLDLSKTIAFFMIAIVSFAIGAIMKIRN